MYIQTINHLEVSFEHFLGFLDILIASENLDHGHIMFMAAVMFPVFTIERQIYNFGNIGALSVRSCLNIHTSPLSNNVRMKTLCCLVINVTQHKIKCWHLTRVIYNVNVMRDNASFSRKLLWLKLQFHF